MQTFNQYVPMTASRLQSCLAGGKSLLAIDSVRSAGTLARMFRNRKYAPRGLQGRFSDFRRTAFFSTIARWMEHVPSNFYISQNINES